MCLLCLVMQCMSYHVCMQGGAHSHHNACGRRTDPRPSSTCAPGAQCLLILCCTLLNEGREVSSHQDMLTGGSCLC